MSAARTLKAAIDRSAKVHRPESITDEFAQAVAHKLQSRQIARVPGLPAEEPQWFDMAIEHQRRQQKLNAEREARRDAEHRAQEATQTTASILLSEIAKAATAGGSATIPLNGAAVLWAALIGGGGTINGEQV